MCDTEKIKRMKQLFIDEGVTFKITRVLSIRSRHVLYEFKQGRYLPCFFMVNNGLSWLSYDTNHDAIRGRIGLMV